MARKLWILVLLSFAILAFAQDEGSVTVNIADTEAYGPILTDAAGMSLYLFINAEVEMSEGSMMESVRAEAKSCTEGCLAAWPPLVATEVTAGEGVNADLLYTAEFDGLNFVVYNGWPLYYFASDLAPGDTMGQGKGTWHLVTPEGEPVPVGE
jgi:predicted lipoprotein with Yx(FWY)xxD motif